MFGHPGHPTPTPAMCGMWARRSSTDFCSLFWTVQLVYANAVVLEGKHAWVIWKACYSTNSCVPPSELLTQSVRVGPEGCTANTLPGAAAAAGQGPPLWATCPESLAFPHRQMAPAPFWVFFVHSCLSAKLPNIRTARSTAHWSSLFARLSNQAELDFFFSATNDYPPYSYLKPMFFAPQVKFLLTS